MLRGLNFHEKPINKPLFSVMSVKSMYKKANADFVFLPVVFLYFPSTAAQRFAFAKHGAGVGVDSILEQEKPEARKMFENAADSRQSIARFFGQFLLSKD